MCMCMCECICVHFFLSAFCLCLVSYIINDMIPLDGRLWCSKAISQFTFTRHCWSCSKSKPPRVSPTAENNQDGIPQRALNCHCPAGVKMPPSYWDVSVVQRGSLLSVSYQVNLTKDQSRVKQLNYLKTFPWLLMGEPKRKWNGYSFWKENNTATSSSLIMVNLFAPNGHLNWRQ